MFCHIVGLFTVYESLLLDLPKIFYLSLLFCPGVFCIVSFCCVVFSLCSFGLSVSGYGSLCPCLCCRLNVRALVKYVLSSVLRLHCVTRVITTVFSLYVVFGLLCQYAASALL